MPFIVFSMFDDRAVQAAASIGVWKYVFSRNMKSSIQIMMPAAAEAAPEMSVAQCAVGIMAGG
ncbi:hypothetical protein [Mangrovicella endophytica]|uniref:hypothetical protein n=1 Tax=Mangrovicella endophytica TaxID=2066697 RepID=UPI0012FFEEC8|nr:hypothetical protein [Mangrovicella endophytica]